MSVRAKFVVNSVTQNNSNAGEVSLSAVTNTSEENSTFWKYTPAGNITMHIDNPVAFDQFKIGEEYYVDFVPCQ